MLLALLREVAGRLGGAIVRPSPLALLMALMLLMLLTLRPMGGAPPMAGPGMCRLSLDICCLSPLTLLMGGPLEGGGVPLPIGGGVPLRDAARGGGGVALLAGVMSAPAFLFTQRLASGS